MEGLRVAQVRILFNLPPQFGHCTGPLAYIEWFTPLGSLDAQTGMYVVSRSTRHRRCNASIVPIDRIARGCHLIGKCNGPISEKGWNTTNVLDKAQQFYVNHYVHVDAFAATKIK